MSSAPSPRGQALVPVKRLGTGKSRLAGALEREQLDALTLEMLRDLVDALRRTPSVAQVAVVTPDPEVGEAARKAGAEALVRSDPGLNASLDAATTELGLGTGEPLLVVLGDVAGAEPPDLEALFEALRAQGGRGAVLAPAADGGSAALLRAPADAIPSCFGPQSGAAHREAAETAGVPFRELACASLALDLDRPEDLERFLQTPGQGGARTRRLLAEFLPVTKR